MSALWRGSHGGSAEISDEELARELRREAEKCGKQYNAQAKHRAWIMRTAADRLDPGRKAK